MGAIRLQGRHHPRLLGWCLHLVILVMAMDGTVAWFHRRSPPDAGVATASYQSDYSDTAGRSGSHLVTPRGGSSSAMEMATASSGGHGEQEHREHHWEEQYEDPFQPPRIHLEHMSLALRLTSEWNRRLMDGVSKRLSFLKHNDATLSESEREGANHRQQALQQRGGSHPVNVHSYRTWHQPIAEGPEEDDNVSDQDLTLFHAKSPREQKKSKKPRRGVSRWGPELLPYLEHVVDLLGLNNKVHSDGVEIALAMIYLDRACSVETPRSSGVPPCPFCTPRTVHRLSLVALLIAAQAVHGGSAEEYYEKLQSLGIPLSQLEEMLDWMKGALGDPGLLVTVGQMKDWSHRWDCIFYPQEQQEHQHSRLEHHYHYQTQNV